MKVLHIKDGTNIDQIEKMIKQGKHVFILIYMVGCGPCNATRPEWEKLESALADQYAKNDNLVIIDVNKDYIDGIEYFKDISGFPTIRYINNNGKNMENYEDSSINKKDRSVSSFIDWIESNILKNKIVSKNKTSSPNIVFQRISKIQHHKFNNSKTKKRNTQHKNKKSKKQFGGKWSKKYKKSINCNRPKGFSQKQYCKYGRK